MQQLKVEKTPQLTPKEESIDAKKRSDNTKVAAAVATHSYNDNAAPLINDPALITKVQGQ